MKIAIVHDYIAKVGGAQNVLKVIHEIFPEAPIYTLLYDKEGTKGEFEDGYRIITSSLQRKPRWLRKRTKLMLTQFPRAIEEFDFTGYDVVISSSNSYAHGIITRPDTLHICYCYSPMRYAWDWHSEYLVENNLSKGLLSIMVQKILMGIRQWDFVSSKRVDKWVAISKTVKHRINKYYRSDADVIYPPADISEMLDSKSVAGDYYLVLSHLTPYKKIDLAVEAFNKNGKKLIVAGEGPDFKRLQGMISGDNIEMRGYVSQEEAKKLLLNCRAFIFPGEEDFGLTPVEAMACGKPVIAYVKGGVSESVLSGKTGYFFSDVSSDSLNLAVAELEQNFDKISVSECKKRAELFSTERFIKTFRSYVEKEFERYHEKH